MPDPFPAPDPRDDLLPVTDDLLLTEEQVQQLMEESQSAGSLGQAVLQTGQRAEAPPPPPPPAHVPSPPPVTRTVIRRVTTVPARNSSAGPLLTVAAVVVLGGGAAAWWLLNPKSDASALEPSKVDEIVQALPPAADPAAPPGKTAAAIAKAAPASVRTNPVLAAELFDYPPGGPLQGLDGGIGWSGPWTAAQTSIAAASLIGGLPAAAGPGGHAVLTSGPQVTLSRPFAAPPWDVKTGGEWWTSLLISQTGGDAAEDCALFVNLQSAAQIDSAIRLTLTQKGTTFTLTGNGAAKPLSFTWEAGAPIQFVARTIATPAAKDTFDWRMELWLNPLPDQLIKGKVKPDLTLSAKAAPAPSFYGISLQKPARKTPGGIRLDDILQGKAAAAVVH